MAKDKIVWENQGLQQLKFDEAGQDFEGYLIQIEYSEGFNDQMTFKYHFRNDAAHWILYGSTVLDRILQNGEVGAYYRITFTGERKPERGFSVKA